jgi:predicted nucleic acid-binding protein
MYKKIFLDANILADIYDKNRPYFTYSEKVISLLLEDENIQLFTSCDIITTLYYILSKQDKKKALDVIVEVNEWCEVVDFANDEIKECCLLMKKNSAYKDLEDTIQYVMAKKVSSDLILSNDKGFVSDEIRVMSSEEFLKKK